MSYSIKTGPFPEPPENLRRVIESLRPRWRWIVALGALIAGMGAVALFLVVSATIASVYAIAVFMIVAGAAEIATGLGAKTWRRFVVWICAG
ncbi:MAG: HdeD family acid-resistance protein, partial [Methylocella sp.]